METVSLSYHIWVVGGLTFAIVGLAIYIAKNASKLEKIAKESNILITKTNLVIEANTKSHDRMQDYFVNGKKK